MCIEGKGVLMPCYMPWPYLGLGRAQSSPFTAISLLMKETHSLLEEKSFSVNNLVRGYKLFSCSTQISMKFSLLINAIVGIFIFIRREIFMLSCVKQERVCNLQISN